jgi:iron complex transport system substrate-binding protein
MKIPFYFVLMFLVSSTMSTVMPVAASDYTLEIFGNSNMDDTINADDTDYIKGIINGKNEVTKLADANYDGKIDDADIAQIEQIIDGTEKELTFVDLNDKAVTVKKPVKRIVVLSDAQADAMRVLGLDDAVVGIGSGLADETILLPDICRLPAVGVGERGESPDYEAILALEPDIVLPAGTSGSDLESKLAPNVTVVRFDFNQPELTEKRMAELGYIFNKRQEAEDFCEYYSDILNKITEKTANLSEDSKPRVFYCGYPSRGYRYYAIAPQDWLGSLCTLAGGNNIAANLAGPMVDPEWVLSQNPDIILIHEGSGLPSGYDTDDATEAENLIAEIASEQEIQNTNAAIDKKIYIESSDVDSGPQSIIALAYIAKLLNPEIFDDLDPKEIHSEYLERFQRIDYNLDEHGVFCLSAGGGN